MRRMFCEQINPLSAQGRHGHVRVARVGSIAGGGWTSHIPSPGGAMEGGGAP
jgi:hypothetical protein